MDPATHTLEALKEVLARQKSLAERAIAQLDDESLHWIPDRECNSVAILVKHVAGNMRSRWTDFLTSDGEKPDRNRDGEFVDDFAGRDELMARWEEGWRLLFDALDSLEGSQLTEQVTVGGKPVSVAQALLGQMAHYAQHVGQIIYLAKWCLGDDWETLSIPRRRPSQ